MENAPGPPSDDLKPYLRTWIASALAERPCSVPDDDFFALLRLNLGDGMLSRLVRGLREGLVIQHGRRFQTLGMVSRPLLWFSEHSGEHGLRPNWEEFINVDYFLRLRPPCIAAGLKVTFEDRGMDIVVSKGQRLWWYFEVKVKDDEVESLRRDLVKLGSEGVDVELSERANKALPKAKYLVKYRPEFFSVAALNAQSHNRVTFPDATHFSLEKTDPPLAF